MSMFLAFSTSTTSSTNSPLDDRVAEQPGETAPKLDKLAQQNLDLLSSGNFADAEIVCNGATWKVHKLILRTRCPWFEKAFGNNWKESQTGQIRLEEEQPEQVDELLRFIYSGRYVPTLAPRVGCISLPYLVSNIRLWRTADFFLLPDLKTEIYDYLLERLAAILCCLHDFRLSLESRQAAQTRNYDEKELDDLIVDVATAVETIYGSPDARQVHKLFAVFACGLREHWPAESMRRLMKDVPQFQQDISTALIALHFPNITCKFVVGGLEELCVSEAWNVHSAWSSKDFISFKCSNCGKGNPNAMTRRHSRCKAWDMTLDPFSLGTRKWCNDCAIMSTTSRMKTIISGWPVDVPGMV